MSRESTEMKDFEVVRDRVFSQSQGLVTSVKNSSERVDSDGILHLGHLHSFRKKLDGLLGPAVIDMLGNQGSWCSWTRWWKESASSSPHPKGKCSGHSEGRVPGSGRGTGRCHKRRRTGSRKGVRRPCETAGSGTVAQASVLIHGKPREIHSQNRKLKALHFSGSGHSFSSRL